MSFFSSLQQYVASGVAGLGLSPRRFSLSRQDSTEGEKTSGSPGSRSGSTGSAHAHVQGFPKVVPPPGTTVTGLGRRTASCETASQGSPLRCGELHQRGGSFRRPPSGTSLGGSQMQSGLQSGQMGGQNSASPSLPPLAFCKRRLSWPEVQQQSTSGVQDTDGGFFEAFTALSWKHIRMKQHKEPFGMSPEKHYRLLNVASEEKPPIVVLSVVVLEADGLEAKDANGFFR
ncbi:uncharacterized protein LOC113388417 [Ctenocephalides felis]|uniref:uncharacterized protein LOC113388417 n=1 Tax=Ctenocephalides felis TaxID=7515 RepID=UPI000E6E541B|nr:uncharacterized protein LOC113388417 [Ctenocephalides felis]